MMEPLAQLAADYDELIAGRFELFQLPQIARAVGGGSCPLLQNDRLKVGALLNRTISRKRTHH